MLAYQIPTTFELNNYLIFYDQVKGLECDLRFSPYGAPLSLKTISIGLEQTFKASCNNLIMKRLGLQSSQK